MTKYPVAGTAPQDAPTVKQDAAFVPTLATFVGVPLAQAAVPGVIGALCLVIVASIVLVFTGLAAEPRAWFVALAAAALLCLGVTARYFPERRQEIRDGWRKREVRDGVDYDGDGHIGTPPRDPIPARSQGKPADARGEARRALLRRFVEKMYSTEQGVTTYDALRPIAGSNQQVRAWFELLASDSYGVIWMQRRGQRETVGGFLVDKAEALRIIDTAVLPPDDA